MGRLSQPSKPPAPKHQRTSVSFFTNPRFAALTGSARKATATKARSPASRFSLQAGLGLSKSKLTTSPKAKARSRLSLGAFPLPSSQQEQQQRPKFGDRKSDTFSLVPAAVRHKSSPVAAGPRRSLFGAAFGLGGGLGGALGSGMGDSDDDADSQDDEEESGSSESEDSESENGSGSEQEEGEPRQDKEGYDAPESLYLDPAFEKKKLKQLSRGALFTYPAADLAEKEQVLAKAYERSKVLYIEGMADAMQVELLKTIDAMEQRVERGTAQLRQGKDKVVDELVSNFEQARLALERLTSLSERIMSNRKELAGELAASRESTTTKLENISRNYADTCTALRKSLPRAVGSKKAGGGGGKKR